MWNSNLLYYPLFWGSVMGASYCFTTITSYYYCNQENNSDDWLPINLNDHDIRLSIASQTMSMGHAVSSLILSSYSIYTGPQWNIINTPLQNIILQNSIGYFMFDQLYIILAEWTWEFTIHHQLAISYFLSSLYLNHGGYYATIALILAEITNPLMITWSFARKNRLKKLYQALSPFFTYYFTIVRCGIIPIASVYLGNVIFKDQYIANKWKILWGTSCIGLNIAGFIWSYWLCTGYLKMKKKKLLKQEIDP